MATGRGPKENANYWPAMLAGRNCWPDADRALTVAQRCCGAVQLYALLANAATVVVAWRVGSARYTQVEWVAVVLLGVVSAVAAIGAVRTVLGRTARARPLALNLALRSALGVAMVASLFSLTPGWGPLLSWHLAIVIGVDTALTADAIGWRFSAWRWWVSFALSPLHLGVVGGLIGFSIAGPTTTLAMVLPALLTLHLWALGGCLTASGAQRLFDVESEATAAVQARTAADEHRRSAHWLHDDICAQLRLTALKVQRAPLAAVEVVALLDELDFAIRLRQLDELIVSGSVRVAEVIQPFVRRAQHHGVTVESVPSYDVAAVVVDRHTGNRLRRTAAVLVSNALNAGARSMSIKIGIERDVIEVAVVDDAGGFDASAMVPGRGLWSLAHDLGWENVTIDRVGSGSNVRARVPLNDGGRTHDKLAVG